MIPIFSHVEEIGDLSVAVTTDGIVSAGFTLDPCDPEIQDTADFHKRLVQALREIDPSVVVRVELSSEDRKNLSGEFPRARAINEIGFVENRICLYLDAHPWGMNLFRRKKRKGSAALLVDSLKVFESLGLKLAPLEKPFEEAFEGSLSIGERSLETETESIGVVRVLKQPDREFSFEDLNQVLEEIPRPYRFVVSFCRIGEAKAQVLLERKIKQLEGSKRVTEKIQSDSTLEALSESFRSGAQLFEMEALLVLKRDSQSELSRDLRTSKSALSLFSESLIETFGVLPSYAASLPGSRQHVVQVENENALIQSLPLFQMRSSSGENIMPKRSLTLQRRDNSLFQFDLFDPSFNAFNALIVGPSGKGKSVLTGLLTSSILGDSNVHVIKIDVGGSHSKECEIFGGEEYSLTLDRPSGVNAFEVMKHKVSEADKLAIVSKFLTVLIQEQGELSLTKDMRSEVEASVREYIDSKPMAPSLQDFYDRISNFPRRNLLRRWVQRGVYEKAFSADAGSVKDRRDETEPAELLQLPGLPALQHCARLRYFNFQSVFQAADPEFAVAGFAALMAEVNTQVLSQDGRRLVLVLDEIPFFIKHCFELIKFTVANFRKYGHAVICVAQVLEHLIVHDDMGIIENTPQRFLFNEEPGKYLEVNPSQLQVLKEMRSIPGQYSEVGFLTEEGMRKLTIKLSKEEYWERTSSKTDKEKLRKLMESVPKLSLRQAIACLSLAER